MKYLFLIFLILVSANAIASETCSLTENQVQEYMLLDFKSFDQNLPDGGWRKFGNNGCYATASLLLDRYRETHPQLEAQQQRIIVFHSGQMLAYAGAYTEAIKRFENSYTDDQQTETFILWNDYVRATIAFLKKDKTTLLEMREKIVNGPTFQEQKLNLHIVDRFIKHFDESYAAAYGASD